jgi:hypothetical protein
MSPHTSYDPVVARTPDRSTKATSKQTQTSPGKLEKKKEKVKIKKGKKAVINRKTS